MYYSGYDQGYAGQQSYDARDQGYDAGAQGYAGDQGYGYQQQPQMTTMGDGGYHNGNTQYAQDYVEPSAYDDQRSSGLKSKKSFSGPPPGADRKRSMSRMRSTRSIKKSDSTGMARHGSVFVGNRERDTQVSISTRGGMSMHCPGDDADDLKEYYGDMAGRVEVRKMDGLKAIKSYRGGIEDGEDVGKPRRVTNRRNVDGRSATGYGGINFKRQSAMRNGEKWGDVEIRLRDGTRRREADEDVARPRQLPQSQPQMPMYGQQMFAAPVVEEEGPAVPRIYSQEDIHSYSNLSDAFTENEEMEEDEGGADL